MQAGAISNIGFAGKKPVDEAKMAKKTKKAEQRQQNRKRYFEYVSKVQANDALVMSKDREEEDGKFKAASFFTGAAALLSAGLAGHKLSGALSKINVTKYEALNTAKLAVEDTKEYAKKMKGAKAFGIGALVLAATSMVISAINKEKAQDTAKERGFYTQRQFMYGTRTAKEKYEMVEKAYDKTVKK